MTNAEIEDVLSSIRRLVSEDLRPAPEPRVRVQVQPRPQKENSLLLLTPSLRVAQPPQPEPHSEPQPQKAPEATVAPALEDDWDDEIDNDSPIDTQVAVLEDASEWDEAAIDAEFGEATDSHPVVDPYAYIEKPDAAPILKLVSAHSDENDDDFAQSDLSMTSVLPFMSYRAATQPQATPDAAAARAAEAIPGSAPESMPVDPVSDIIHVPVEDEGLAEPHLDEFGFTLRTEQDPVYSIEPDADWADEAEASAIAELEDDPDAAMAFAGTNPSYDAGRDDLPEAIYDEDLLRDLVRDILKEELQGAMGERITRNIRKMVRAEIARALATQDIV